MFDYESPIKVITDAFNTQYENGVLKAVQRVGFDVNKEELTKALLYDRGQYDKGYEDASADLDILLNELIVPMAIENVCEEIHDWGMDENDETWCSRNCGVINDGTCPSAECYRAWIRMKKGE